MIRLPLLLTVADAETISGTLSKVTAMPGWSHSLDARRCRRGARIRAVADSVCSRCYAMGGAYLMPHVREAHALRHLGLQHPRWVDAMVVLIAHRCRPPDQFFRWHDSGDLQGTWHLRNIVEVCRRTPSVQHWLPTREYDDVAEYLRTDRPFPENLVVRLSAHMIDAPTSVPHELAHLPTSTVQSKPERRHLPVVGKGSIVCHATDGTRDECGECRACWNPRVTNVSYVVH